MHACAAPRAGYATGFEVLPAADKGKRRGQGPLLLAKRLGTQRVHFEKLPQTVQKEGTELGAHTCWAMRLAGGIGVFACLSIVIICTVFYSATLLVPLVVTSELARLSPPSGPPPLPQTVLPSLPPRPPPPNPPPLEALTSAMALEDRLNYAWIHSWLIVHVIDNGADPKTMSDLARYKQMCENGTEVWAQVGRPRMSPYQADVLQDAIAASGINAMNPNVFRPGFHYLTWSHGTLRRIGELLVPYQHMPIVILNASSIKDRVNCCTPFDAGSNGRKCPTLGGDEHCVPGCVNLHRRDVEACFSDTHYFWNEVVLDVWKDGGWGEGAMKGRYITALALDVNASSITRKLARDVQRAAAAEGLPLPLFAFDPKHQTAPFKFWRLAR